MKYPEGKNININMTNIVIYIFILGFAFLVFTGCTQPEFDLDATTTLTINPQGAPKALTSIGLEVSGSGMETITESIDPEETEITLEVPAGEGRKFSLNLENDWYVFSGSVSENLTAGDRIDVTIPIEISESKYIIFPDAQGSTIDGTGHQIIYVEDISGAGWGTSTYTDLGFPQAEFLPYDIDIDSAGRIYTANYSNSTSIGIIRLDDLTDTNYEEVKTGIRIRSIAVDRTNDYIYYYYLGGDYDVLARKKIQGSTIGGEETFSVYGAGDGSGYTVGGFNPYDLAVNQSSGTVYFIHYNSDLVSYEILEVDPDLPFSERIVSHQTVSMIGDAWAIDYKNGKVLIGSFYDDPDSGAVQQYSSNLDYEDQFTGEQGGSDPFLGVKRFVGVLRKKFYLIDEYSSYDSSMDNDGNNRLIEFDDVTGAGWSTLSAIDAGQSEPFFFYSKY